MRAKGFYSLIQVFLLLAYMALARIKTIEQLQYHPAGEWGKLLGLDRIPEVRTLREKVKVLAQPKAVTEWGQTLSQEWMEAGTGSGGVSVRGRACARLPRRPDPSCLGATWRGNDCACGG